MRRITLWIMSTLSMVVMLFSYHTSLDATASSVAAVTQQGSSASTNAGAVQTTTSGSGSAGAAGSSGWSSGSGAASKSGTKTYTGAAATDPYGQVQVRITVANGKVATSEAIQYPMDNGRDQEINSVAIPELNSEATGASSAQLNMISGATFTTNAYSQSLQSALDAANI